jgi:CubicO group peptidase (beta-lactamase class C family)
VKSSLGPARTFLCVSPHTVDNGVHSEPDRRFRLASVTKPITATGILKLVHDGQLKLTDKPFGASGMPGVPTIISGIVPGPLALTGSASFNPALSAITVDEILHHAGGWRRDGGPGKRGSHREWRAPRYGTIPPNFCSWTGVHGGKTCSYARQLGLTNIPVILSDEWTPAQVKTFRLMVNRSAT